MNIKKYFKQEKYSKHLFGKRAILLLFTAAVLFLFLVSTAPVAGQTTLRADFRIVTISPDIGEEVAFDASDSYGAGNLNYTWDFGDGGDGYGVYVKHIYSSSGTHTVTLVVENQDGDIDVETKTVYIYDDISDELMGLSMLFGGMICFIYAIMILIMLAIWITNLVLLIVFNRKMKRISEEMGLVQEANTYILIQLIIGIVGLVMFNFIMFTIVGQIIVYVLFKSKMDSIKQFHNRYNGRPQGPYYAQPPPAKAKSKGKSKEKPRKGKPKKSK